MNLRAFRMIGRLSLPVILLAIGFPLRSDIVISNPNGAGSGAGYDNVLFNGTGDITAGLNLLGNTQHGGYFVAFLGQELLSIQGGGQAQIRADDGGFTNLVIALSSLNPGTFTQLKFLVESATDGHIQIAVTEGNGAITTATFPMLHNGTNWYTTVAINGEDISKVALDSSISGGADMTDVQQVRMGGIQPVPEPAAIGLFGTVLFIALYSQRRRAARQ